MTEALIAFGRQALILSVWLVAPIAIAGMVAAIVTGLIAWVTQLQDPAIAIVPRMIAVVAALAITGPSIGHELALFGTRLFEAIAVVGT